MTGTLLLLFGLVSAYFSSLAVRRRAPWLPAMVSGELAPVRIVVTVAVSAVLVWGGALESSPGWIGLAAVALSLMIMAGATVIAYRSGRRAAAQVAKTVGARSEDVAPAPPSLVGLVRPQASTPGGVERVSDVPYGPHGTRNLADLYLPRQRDGDTPVIVQIHGGAWRGGRKEQQGRPLLHHLAGRGWAGVAISYRLSPAATLPEHLVDVKRALAWLRRGLTDYGIRPGFVAITGGSAGGHLAALAALTVGQPEYQPGFEDDDTSVGAAVPFYGVYDLADRNQVRAPWPFLERIVLKAPPDVPLWGEMSPLDRVHRHAPPFLVLHGSHDSLVPAAEAQQFVAALRGVSAAPVVYAEVSGANHAFDVLASVRSRRVAGAVYGFLEAVREGRHDDGL